MCMACEEMALYYAYLDAVEEAKLRTQPWECEITLFPQESDDRALRDANASPAPIARAAAPARKSVGKPAAKAGGKSAAKSAAKSARKPAAGSGFSCDAPE